MVHAVDAEKSSVDAGPRSPAPSGILNLAGVAVGTALAALAAGTFVSAFESDFDTPSLPYRRRAPQPPSIPYHESRRHRRAAAMIVLQRAPVPLKHMHAAARRRALLADGDAKQSSTDDAAAGNDMNQKTGAE